MAEIDYKRILLQLIGSLTLADHMGDVWQDMEEALRRVGLEPPDCDNIRDLGNWLGKMGVTTLYGTALVEDDEDA